MTDHSLRGARNVHLMGIAGSGMSSLASLLLAMDKQVSGCDLSPAATGWLEARGARVALGHAAEHLTQADLLVVSSAVRPDDPELEAARLRGVRTLTHAQALGELMQGRRGIAVAGTHGKSTTTALTAFLLHAAGLDPTLIGGAESVDFGGASRPGMGEAVVVEADEYDRRFLELTPHIAIVTSVEPDHLDYFADLDEIVDAFRAFLARLPPDGLAVVCHDDARAVGLPTTSRRVSYGFGEGASYRIEAYEVDAAHMPCLVLRAPDGSAHKFRSALLGRHNAANSVAAIAVARDAGVDWDTLKEALPNFRGTRRRFEHVGTVRGIRVYDDYAHHPSAVRATLAAAREWHQGPIWVAFQPHTTHRTAALLEDFAAALAEADHAVLVPIYEPPGRELKRQHVSSDDLAERIPNATACASLEEAAQLLAGELDSGTLVLTMGAGDVTRLGPMVVELVSRGGP